MEARREARGEAVALVVTEGTVKLTPVSGPVRLTETSAVKVRAEGGALGLTLTTLTAVLEERRSAE